MKVGLIFLLAASVANPPKTKQLTMTPMLHMSRTVIVKALGEPDGSYLPEYDRNISAMRPTRRAWASDSLFANRLMWLSTPVAETYQREYEGVPFEMDIYYEADNYRAGLVGPMRAVGFAWSSTVQVHYPDVLPEVPWFNALCHSGCDAMEYTTDGSRYSLVCPPHPTASTVAEALILPRTPCLRANLVKEHPGFLMIQYAEFLPAAEELLAEGKVVHTRVDMEGVQ